MRKDFDAIGIQSVLTAEEVVIICRISLATLYRWLKESRSETGGRFPLPIDTGGAKRRLKWSRASIEQFLNGQEQNSVKPETPTQRRQRANVARVDLERRGVKINPEN